MKSFLTLGILFLAQTVIFSQNTMVKSVYFGGGSYYIDAIQQQEIKDFIQSVPNIQHYSITVSSHTDNIGGAEYNQWLSQMRSRSVLFELDQLKIPLEKVGVENNGQFNPFFDNHTNKGRRANRRVDIILEPLLL